MSPLSRPSQIERWEKDNLCGVCPYRKAVQAENERLREALQNLQRLLSNAEAGKR